MQFIKSTIKQMIEALDEVLKDEAETEDANVRTSSSTPASVRRSLEAMTVSLNDRLDLGATDRSSLGVRNRDGSRICNGMRRTQLMMRKILLSAGAAAAMSGV
ncbi:hypothetical protein, partial [Glycomyces buryatensis]|uniref:hypothetical protein n=1 Tax=Glycomyces buryatensis TaxID=2570927 RepID=UPI001B3C16F4